MPAPKPQYFSTLDGTELKNKLALKTIKNGDVDWPTLNQVGYNINGVDLGSVQWRLVGYRVYQDANHGGVEIKGKRYKQEDRMVVAQRLSGFSKLKTDQARQAVILKTFKAAQAKVSHIEYGGSTAIISAESDGKLYTAGLGDAVTYKVYRRISTGEIVYCKRLNEIHSPEKAEEKKRIEDLGGKVITPFGDSTLRVNGELAVSRAFGDNEYKTGGKELVSSDPGEVYVEDVLESGFDPADIEVFQVTSCDGLTERAKKTTIDIDNPSYASLKDLEVQDVHSKQQRKLELDELYIARLFLNSKEFKSKSTPGKQSTADLSAVSMDFAEQALEDGSADNISINIRRLNPVKKTAENKAKADKADITAIFDGHSGSEVAAILADENNGFMALLAKEIKVALRFNIVDKIKQKIDKLSNVKEIPNFKELIKDPEQALKSFKTEKGNYPSYELAQILFAHRKNSKFVQGIGSDITLINKVTAIAKADPEAAKKIFLAKTYTELSAKEKRVRALQATQIADILKTHADKEGFLNSIFKPLHSNINLTTLAEHSINTFSIILSSPKLNAKLGPEKILKIAKSLLAAGKGPVFPVWRSAIEYTVSNSTIDLSLAKAMIFAQAGSAKAAYYLAVLYDIQSQSKDI